MARKIAWTRSALSDVEALAEFIARDSEFYAAGFVKEIFDTGDALDQLCERGRVVPELSDPSIRELLIHDYRLIYAVEKNVVSILALIHGKRILGKSRIKKRRIK